MTLRLKHSLFTDDDQEGDGDHEFENIVCSQMMIKRGMVTLSLTR